MSILRCKICGGTVIFEPGASVGVCEYCGTRQTKETAPAAPVKQVVQIVTAADLDSLVNRAFLALGDGNYRAANGFCEQALNLNSECAEAYLAKLMVSVRAKKREELAWCTRSFRENADFQKAIRFGSPELRSELEGYLSEVEETINSRTGLEYDAAVRLMQNADNKYAYLAAARGFHRLGAFRDSASLEFKCRELANQDPSEARILELSSERRQLALRYSAYRNKNILPFLLTFAFGLATALAGAVFGGYNLLMLLLSLLPGGNTPSYVYVLTLLFASGGALFAAGGGVAAVIGWKKKSRNSRTEEFTELKNEILAIDRQIAQLRAQLNQQRIQSARIR